MESSRDEKGLSIIHEPSRSDRKLGADFDVETREEEGITVLVLRGVLNIYSSHELKDTLFHLADRREVRIVLDLSQLSGIDSAGIGVIISMMHRIRRISGAQMILCGLSGHVEKVFMVTRIISLFNVVSSVDEALTQLRG